MRKQKAIWDAASCALVLIDYQPEMLKSVRSGDPRAIELNVRALARGARALGVPVILSTVAVGMGVNRPTLESLRREIPDVPEIDRSSMNAWEDPAFLSAVQATGRRRLIFAALWTEICLAYPVIDALASGYEACFVADAVGGESKVEHDTAILRLVQAGAVPNTTLATVAEWFRDWKSPMAQAGREVLLSLWREREQLAA